MFLCSLIWRDRHRDNLSMFLWAITLAQDARSNTMVWCRGSVNLAVMNDACATMVALMVKVSENRSSLCNTNDSQE